jgi:hypothetical protein
MRQALGMVAVVALLLAAMALKGLLVAPPGVAATSFDTTRAMARLQRILGDQRPHPVDSAADDAVRARIAAEMRAVGLDPRVTDSVACNDFAHFRAVSCARARNLVARIGPDGGRALLVAAHYDSTFAGPGAGDDGIGVATLLEVAEGLRGRRLARPVIFLIDEGEEAGLIGARAFLANDPMARDVDMLVNMEARGVTGPAIMFETSRPNAAAIALYRNAPRPVANSLSADLYALIPNSTDVSVFAERPWTILNFAIIGNETRYHSAGDDLAALDPASVRHMGIQVAAVVDAALQGAPTATGTRLYADVLGGLVVLPLLFGLILLGLLTFFFLAAALHRRALGRPLLAVVTSLAGAIVLANVGQLVLGLLRAGDYWRGWPVVTLLAVYASAIAAALVALRRLARDGDARRLRAAYWLVFTLVGAAISIVAPGGAIFFLAPPLIAALGIVGTRWGLASERIGGWLAILCLYLTFGPALALFEELMKDGPQWMFAPLGTLILLPVLIELAPRIAKGRWLYAGSALLYLVGWIAAGVVPAYTSNRQQLFTTYYLWDADAHRGRWMLNSDGARLPPDHDWAREELPYAKTKRWLADAPAAALTAPAATVLASAPEGNGRRIRLRVAANGAESYTLVAPADAALRAAGIAGFVRPFGTGKPDDRYVVACTGRACDGATYDIVTATRAPLELMLVGSRPGLPPSTTPPSRPALARPQYAPDSTIAFARLRL